MASIPYGNWPLNCCVPCIHSNTLIPLSMQLQNNEASAKRKLKLRQPEFQLTAFSLSEWPICGIYVYGMVKLLSHYCTYSYCTD